MDDQQWLLIEQVMSNMVQKLNQFSETLWQLGLQPIHLAGLQGKGEQMPRLACSETRALPPAHYRPPRPVGSFS